MLVTYARRDEHLKGRKPEPFDLTELQRHAKIWREVRQSGCRGTTAVGSPSQETVLWRGMRERSSRRLLPATPKPENGKTFSPIVSDRSNISFEMASMCAPSDARAAPVIATS
jgi:hypothetical protein